MLASNIVNKERIENLRKLNVTSFKSQAAFERNDPETIIQK